MKRTGRIIYHLLGVLFPIFASSLYGFVEDKYLVYYQYAPIFATSLIIYILLGVYIAAHKIVAKSEKMHMTISMCTIYFFLTIPVFFLRFLDVVGSSLPRWIIQGLMWLYNLETWHIWTILFGYYMSCAVVYLRERKKLPE